MNISYEVNEYGEDVKVMTYDSGHVIRELERPAIATPMRIYSKLEFMNRLTDAEMAGIYTAAKSSVAVEVWLEKFRLASEINLDDPRTIAGIQALEAAGLIAAGRAAEILA